MSRSELRHQFMVFDAEINGDATFPLTLDDRAIEFYSQGLPARRCETTFCLPAAPPSTPKSSFEFDYTSHNKSRGASFSSDGSMPSIVEDHSGISDTDADPLTEHDPVEESMTRLWDTYNTLLVLTEASETIKLHLPDYPDDLETPSPPLSSEVMLSLGDSRNQSRVKTRPSTAAQGDQSTLIPEATRSQSKAEPTPKRLGGPQGGQLASTRVTRKCGGTPGGQVTPIPKTLRYGRSHGGPLTTIPEPIPAAKPTSQQSVEPQGEQFTPIQNPTSTQEAPQPHRSHVHRSNYPAINTQKSLPIPPPKRAGPSLQFLTSKDLKLQSPVRPIPHPRQPSYNIFPHQGRPGPNPCNSSHAYSIHNTPPLPLPTKSLVEKSAFEDDTDDDNVHHRVTQLSSSLAKLHIRSFSLGCKPGLNGKKGSNRDGVKGTRRRRSATGVVMGVLGLGKK